MRAQIGNLRPIETYDSSQAPPPKWLLMTVFHIRKFLLDEVRRLSVSRLGQTYSSMQATLRRYCWSREIMVTRRGRKLWFAVYFGSENHSCNKRSLPSLNITWIPRALAITTTYILIQVLPLLRSVDVTTIENTTHYCTFYSTASFSL
jgi:hypothetical protein